MYAYITGKITHKEVDNLIIENNGIGYLVLASSGLMEKFPSVGESAKIHTYHYVREDNIALYGFPTREDLGMFKLLLTVSGVGPKVATTMVGSMDPGHFAMAVVTGDTKALTNVKGIGKKGAERMILELKDKLKNSDLSGAGITSGDSSAAVSGVIGSDQRQSEAISALMVLGYSGSEAAVAVKKVDKPEFSLEELIKLALRQLVR